MAVVNSLTKSDIGKRKHASQMTQEEQTIIWKKLNYVQEIEWEVLPHAFKRLEQKKINASKQDIVSTIYNSTLIEYRLVENKKTGKVDERVILRAKATVNSTYNLHAVYSLTNKKIVTVWMNHIKDRHSTLDWSIYNKDMNILGA